MTATDQQRQAERRAEALGMVLEAEGALDLADRTLSVLQALVNLDHDARFFSAQDHLFGAVMNFHMNAKDLLVQARGITTDGIPF